VLALARVNSNVGQTGRTMSFLKNLFGRGGDSGGSMVAGTWHVTFISVPHPFGRYVLDLRANGALEWLAVVPTTDVGEYQVKGSGTWRTDGEMLHYTSGADSGTVQYSLSDGELILDGLPATKVGPGVRCVFQRVQQPSQTY